MRCDPCFDDASEGPVCCGGQTCSAGEECCAFENAIGTIGCYAYEGGPRCPPGCPDCASDRNIKRDIVPVDPQAVLDQLAQDSTDRRHSPIDAHGVAFAAIQALYERVQGQEARIEHLEKENAELRRRAERRLHMQAWQLKQLVRLESAASSRGQ